MEQKSPLVFQCVISGVIVATCLLLRLIFPETLHNFKAEYTKLVSEIPVLDFSEIERMDFDYDSLSDFRS